MWSHVEQQLSGILAARVYPAILSDNYYRHFLTKAGMGPNFPRDGAPTDKAGAARFAEQAKLEARQVVSFLNQQNSLDQATAQARVLTGPARLYRLWDGSFAPTKVGIWWFTDDILKRCRAEAGTTQEDRFAWLRSFLAVSYDWSRCNRLAQLDLPAGEPIPAIQATGLPVRQYSATGWKRPNTNMADYWRKIDSYFPGGLVQTVLPWVPQTMMRGLPRI